MLDRPAIYYYQKYLCIYVILLICVIKKKDERVILCSCERKVKTLWYHNALPFWLTKTNHQSISLVIVNFCPCEASTLASSHVA
jgi:hypothetical protein